MLSKSGKHGGGVKRQPRFQQVVNTVADLPSTIDAEPGSRIIVRETEEVYGLDKVTRMWSVIGVLKKVGGKLPEELAAHVDAKGNPHGTSLQDVVDVSAKLELTQEILISRKKIDLRLLSGESALRIGSDAGKSDGLVWINAGRLGVSTTVARVVNSDGNDQLVITGDGSLTAAGSARFAGGFKGPAHFEDEITAAEGLFGAKGYDLILGGDKRVVCRVGKQDKLLLTPDGLKVHGALEATGYLAFGGTVRCDLNPDSGRTLGKPAHRWSAAALKDLDIAGQIVVQVQTNSKKPPLKISGAAPGHNVTVSPQGALGLGTDTPKARLDVRGEILVGAGPNRLKISETGLSSAGWSINLTAGDGLDIFGGGRRLLRLTAAGAELIGDSKVTGSLIVSNDLKIGAVQGLNEQSILFRNNRSTAYKAKSHQFAGTLELDAVKGEAPLTVKSAGDTIFSVNFDGTLLGSKLGRESAAWDSAHFDYSVTVGDTVYRHGKVSHNGEFIVDAKTLVAGPELRLVGLDPSIIAIKGMRIKSGNASVLIKPGDKLEFSKPTKLSGVSELAAGKVLTNTLNVSGDAKFCAGKAEFQKGDLRLKGDLVVGGLALRKYSEELDLSTGSATKFEIPAGARVEVVLVKLQTDIGGVRFLMVGDAADPNRFAGPSTNLAAGALIRGTDHWAQSQMIQKVKAPIVVSGDVSASGIVVVTIHYVDIASL